MSNVTEKAGATTLFVVCNLLWVIFLLFAEWRCFRLMVECANSGYPGLAMSAGFGMVALTFIGVLAAALGCVVYRKKLDELEGKESKS